MSRLPPAEKLPLAVRKNLRDEWENKKPDHESKLSELLGETWTVEVDPLQLWPYGKERSYGRDSLGSCLSEYIESGIRRLQEFVARYGDDVKNEINNICHAHVLSIDVDLDKKFTYNGCAVSSSGQLVILFEPDYLDSNIGQALDQEVLAKALNEAPAPADSTLSFTARTAIKKEYDTEIESVQKNINSLLQKEIVLDPNFVDVFAKLKGASNAQDGWERNFGSFLHMYFNALARTLDYQKFGADEMMREGFHEAVEYGKVVFRVVDDGKLKRTYNESVVEDGVLYLQTVPQYFGTNIDDIASNLVDLL